MNRTDARPDFRPDVEGLRGIAVLLVVAYHARVPGFPGGYTGVDVFFVLSGYLITGLLAREHARTGGIALVPFYARRIRRLLPGAAAMLLATLLAGALVLSPLEQRSLSLTAVATAGYASNLWFIRDASDYFSARLETNPLLHTWTLAVEEQFYLVWPVLVLLGLRLGRSRRALAALLAVVALASLAAWLWLTRTHAPRAFFASPTRAWEFAAGGLAALLPVASPRTWRVGRGALGWAGLAAIVGGGVALSASGGFRGWLALLPVAGTVATLVAGAQAPRAGAGALLATRPLQAIGRLSYSWYLWHWPVLVLATTALGPAPLALPTRLLCAVGSLGLAAIAYAGVERPLRFHGALVARPRRTIALGVALTGAGVATALVALAAAVRAAGTPAQRRFTAAATERSAVYHADCITGFADRALRECRFGDTTAATTVVLLGDSHAAQWFPAIERTAARERWRLVTLLKTGCAAADVPVFNPVYHRVEHECAVWRASALRRVASLRPALMVAGTAAQVYVRDWGRQGPAPLSSADWGAGVRRTAARLDAAGVPLVLLRDTPFPGFDVPRCLAQVEAHPWYGAGRCAMPRARVLDDGLAAAEREALTGLRSARVVDLSDAICGAAACPAEREGTVVYLDGNHLTAAFAARLAPAVRRALAPLAGGP